MPKSGATPETAHPALNHPCPFCAAPAGQPCRTHRGRGSETPHPHTRRLELVDPWLAQRAARVATELQALCCECGGLRTVSASYHFSGSDENTASGDGFDDHRGWRLTGSLKCSNCARRTRHAVLRDNEHGFRDYAEDVQRYVLGGKFPHAYPPDLDRLRAQYHARFPQNPYLHHRYWLKEASTAWDAGRRRTTAICGAEMTLTCDPRSQRCDDDEWQFVFAEQYSDTEYEDPETGLSWMDMQCVDCCRVSNEWLVAHTRRWLEKKLAYLACRPEEINDADALELAELLDRIKAREGDSC